MQSNAFSLGQATQDSCVNRNSKNAAHSHVRMGHPALTSLAPTGVSVWLAIQVQQIFPSNLKSNFLNTMLCSSYYI